MKFSTTREELLRPLQLVTGVVERRQTLPVLSNLLIEAGDHGLSLTGSDLEVELVATHAGVSVAEPGSATVPARKLADIWRSLPDGAAIEIAVDGDRSIVRSGRSRFTLATLPAADFPKLGAGEANISLQASCDEVKKLVDKVAFAMAQQDVRYFLNGMLLEVADNYLRSVATDGHRMAMCTLPCSHEGEKKQVIVPRKGVMELNRMIEASEDPVRLSLGDNHLRIEQGGYVLTTKLVDGNFPEYQKVVPSDTSRTMEGDRDTLKQAFQRTAILSNEKYRGVRLTLEADLLTIQANNPEQEEAEETVPIQFDGERMEIGFNVGYLQDVLSVLDSDQVRMSVSDANSSALVEAVGMEDCVYVVMPMRL